MFEPQEFNIESIGAIIKSSKQKMTWLFKIDQNTYKLELEYSLMTDKRRVFLNGRDDNHASTGWVGNNYKFAIQNNSCLITQMGYNFELKVNEINFNYQLNLLKTKREFKFEDQSPDNNIQIKLANNQQQNQKKLIFDKPKFANDLLEFKDENQYKQNKNIDFGSFEVIQQRDNNFQQDNWQNFQFNDSNKNKLDFDSFEDFQPSGQKNKQQLFQEDFNNFKNPQQNIIQQNIDLI